MTNIIQNIFLVILGLVALYILCRILSYAITKSVLQAKKEYTNQPLTKETKNGEARQEKK